MSSLLVKKTPLQSIRVDGRRDSVCQRFGRVRHNNAVGRFSSYAILRFTVRRESPSLARDGKVMRCRSSVVCGTYKTNWQTQKSPYEEHVALHLMVQ